MRERWFVGFAVLHNFFGKGLLRRLSILLYFCTRSFHLRCLSQVDQLSLVNLLGQWVTVFFERWGDVAMRYQELELFWLTQYLGILLYFACAVLVMPPQNRFLQQEGKQKTDRILRKVFRFTKPRKVFRLTRQIKQQQTRQACALYFKTILRFCMDAYKKIDAMGFKTKLHQRLSFKVLCF